MATRDRVDMRSHDTSTRTSPRPSPFQAWSIPSSPMMHGTPPSHSGYQALPGAGYAKRKRGDGEDSKEGETGVSSKRIYSKTTEAPFPLLPRELGPEVVVFSHSGLHLGQLLPSGEILGFIELPPLAQLFDLDQLSSLKLLIKPEHTWIHQKWQQIHRSAGIKSPSWQQHYWPEETVQSGAVNKFHTFRAIKTFRELGERMWQGSGSAPLDGTLNLLLKEMDYIVLLLLAHRHQDDQVLWLNRLKVLFGRLDPALRPRKQFANPTSSAVAPEPNAEDSRNRTQSFFQPSVLPTLEHAKFLNDSRKATISPLPKPTLSPPRLVDEWLDTVEDEPMDM